MTAPTHDDAESEAQQLARKRWEADRRISGYGSRDLGGLAVRGEWDDADSLCQAYLDEARRDLERKAVT